MGGKASGAICHRLAQRAASMTYAPENNEPDLPPHNTEAEQGLLGALLADSASIWPLIRAQLKPDHFFEPLHARLYEVIDSRAGAGKIASPITVKNAFDQDQTLAEIGGMNYLASLVANRATQISAKAYAELLRDLAARRQAMAAARDLITEASTI